MDGQTDKERDKKMDGWTERNKQMDGQRGVHRWMNGQTERGINGWTDRHVNRFSTMCPSIHVLVTVNGVVCASL